MEGALRARLLAAASITARVAQRVFWEDRPQNSSLPAITLTTIVDRREQHMGGFQSVRRAIVQVDVWATSKAEKKAIGEAVIATMEPEAIVNGVRFQRVVEPEITPLNERVETQMIFRDAIRLTLHFSNT